MAQAFGPNSESERYERVMLSLQVSRTCAAIVGTVICTELQSASAISMARQLTPAERG